MWSRKRFDIGWLDLLDGLLGCAACWDREEAQARVEQLWSEQHDALACLSVRSGWDLLLTAANFPPGSEVLVSAVTIPDMAKIAELHGLTIVPLDVDPCTMLPKPEQVASAVTERTKAVLIAHLFGTSAALDEHIEVARRHGLLFVEDCAQAFRGPSFTGHPQADASMFSFGTIKSCTALGGGLLRVRSPELLVRMRELQAAYPVQSRAAYLRRIVKYMGLKAASYRGTFRALIGLLRLAGRDFDRALNNSIRGFPAGSFCRNSVSSRARRCCACYTAACERSTKTERCAQASAAGSWPAI
jgi:dTDP-4-amino-4,6-dideoxygalactose transaminase